MLVIACVMALLVSRRARSSVLAMTFRVENNVATLRPWATCTLYALVAAELAVTLYFVWTE